MGLGPEEGEGEGEGRQWLGQGVGVQGLECMVFILVVDVGFLV